MTNKQRIRELERQVRELHEDYFTLMESVIVLQNQMADIRIKEKDNFTTLWKDYGTN